MKGIVKFMITGNNLDLEEISNKLNITPVLLYKKGDTHIHRNKTIVRKEDCWMDQHEIFEDSHIEVILNSFIDNYCKHEEYIRILVKKYDVTFWLSLYPDSEQYYINFSPEIIKKIALLEVKLELSILYLQAFYEGKF